MSHRDRMYDLLRQERRILGLSQRELAARISTTQSAISDFERGGGVMLRTFMRWADALGFDVILKHRGVLPKENPDAEA